MADSTTANYDLVKPEVGASGNTWGGKTNANWDSVDALIAALDVLTAAAKVTPILADKVSIIDTETDPDTVKTITITQLKALILAAVSLSDTVFELVDNADGTKKLQFQLSGITTGTTRTIIIPDLSGIMALADTAQTFTNKTLTAPIVTDPIFRATNDTATGVVEVTEHISTTPATDDLIWQINHKARDLAAALRTYAATIVRVVDATAASISAVWEVWTAVANTIARRVSVGAGLWMEGATGGDPGVGNINAVEFRENGVRIGRRIGATGSLSGVSTDVAIPADCRKLTIMLTGISANSSNEFLAATLMDAGGEEITGYRASAASLNSGGQDADQSVIDFPLSGGNSVGAATDTVDFTLEFTRNSVDGTKWSLQGSGRRVNGGEDYHMCSGTKSTSQPTTAVRFKWRSGASFDAGTYETYVE